MLVKGLIGKGGNPFQVFKESFNSKCDGQFAQTPNSHQPIIPVYPPRGLSPEAFAQNVFDARIFFDATVDLPEGEEIPEIISQRFMMKVPEDSVRDAAFECAANGIFDEDGSIGVVELIEDHRGWYSDGLKEEFDKLNAEKKEGERIFFFFGRTMAWL